MTSTGPVRFRDVLAVGEFRALWVALGQSAIGDQLTRVALSVLVFARTDSPALTGLAYALTFAPTVVGGVLLSGLADRLPRRSLLVTIDLVRGALVAAMALPRLPIWALFALLILAGVVSAPFSAAVGASLLDIFPDDDSYVVGAALRSLTFQLAQFLGFLVGGVVVAAMGSRSALLVDAATYVLSAAAIAKWVRWRPPARSGLTPVGGRAEGIFAAVRVVARDPLLRTLVALVGLAAVLIVPEGLAAPYADALGAGPVAVGVLLAGLPAGTAVGAALVARAVPSDRRVPAMAIMAGCAGIPLIGLLLRPSIPVTVALLFLVGVGGAYQVLASTMFVRAVPADSRGAALGFAGSVVVASQGLGVFGFGVVADFTGAARAGGIAGLAAAGLGVLLAALLRRVVRGGEPLVAGAAVSE
jgi:predicted MFS family arabinose efflux permease